jgi:hypothetical protein
VAILVVTCAGHDNLRSTFDWERAYGKSYRIELSTDGENRRTVWSTASGDGGLDTASFTGTRARYVRVQGLERGTDWGYSLGEAGVHSSRLASPACRLGRPVRARRARTWHGCRRPNDAGS